MMYQYHKHNYKLLETAGSHVQRLMQQSETEANLQKFYFEEMSRCSSYGMGQIKDRISVVFLLTKLNKHILTRLKLFVSDSFLK